MLEVSSRMKASWSLPKRSNSRGKFGLRNNLKGEVECVRSQLQRTEQKMDRVLKYVANVSEAWEEKTYGTMIMRVVAL